MPTEFNLINKYFTRNSSQADLGVGDDAALFKVSEGHQLAISTDMLVVGTHFFVDCPPYLIGWKSLAVNISDMAAMGAKPKWATLALALPELDEVWLAEFSRGFFACAATFNVDLIGGDTTRGPLTISVTIMGEVPNNSALRRDGAKIDDEIWVSGHLGDASLALAGLKQQGLLSDADLAKLRISLEQPHPRVALGLALRGIANSAIDISDGLLADLGHILDKSNLSANLSLTQIPRSATLNALLVDTSFLNLLLAGGDDYELCFTAPCSAHDEILKIGELLQLKLSAIGQTTSRNNSKTFIHVYDAYEQLIQIKNAGYDHFAQF